MNESAVEFQKLVSYLSATDGVSAGQMFGKACLKFRSKAFVAQQADYVIFKLTGKQHAEALALTDAILWDPSGKGRPMREWVALKVDQKGKFKRLAQAALSYVSTLV